MWVVESQQPSTLILAGRPRTASIRQWETRTMLSLWAACVTSLPLRHPFCRCQSGKLGYAVVTLCGTKESLYTTSITVASPASITTPVLSVLLSLLMQECLELLHQIFCHSCYSLNTNINVCRLPVVLLFVFSTAQQYNNCSIFSWTLCVIPPIWVPISWPHPQCRGRQGRG